MRQLLYLQGSLRVPNLLEWRSTKLGAQRKNCQLQLYRDPELAAAAAILPDCSCLLLPLSRKGGKMFYSPRSITARTLLLPTYVVVAILLYFLTVKNSTGPSFSQINNSVHRYQTTNSIHHQHMIAYQRVEAATKTPACSLDDLSTGRWIRRSPRFSSVDAFLTGSEIAGMLECEGGDDRKLEIVNWVFLSESCPTVEWNQREVVRWLLSSPEGLIIVGGTSSPLRSLMCLNHTMRELL